MSWTHWIGTGSIFGALAVAFGAFGAHALASRLSERDLQIFETGCRYHMYHALALLAVGFVAMRVESTAVRVAGWAFVLGIFLFSGSLYALVFSGVRALGAITPLGGTAFIVGWIALAVSVLKV